MHISESALGQNSIVRSFFVLLSSFAWEFRFNFYLLFVSLSLFLLLSFHPFLNLICIAFVLKLTIPFRWVQSADIARIYILRRNMEFYHKYYIIIIHIYGFSCSVLYLSLVSHRIFNFISDAKQSVSMFEHSSDFCVSSLIFDFFILHITFELFLSLLLFYCVRFLLHFICENEQK